MTNKLVRLMWEGFLKLSLFFPPKCALWKANRWTLKANVLDHSIAAYRALFAVKCWVISDEYVSDFLEAFKKETF